MNITSIEPNMRRYFLTLGVILLSLNFSWAQAVFQKTYGGAGNDRARDVRVMSDSGLVITGDTRTYGQLGGVGDRMEDMMTIRTDQLGGITWSRTSGSFGARERGVRALPANDGGVVISAWSHEDAVDGKDSWYFHRFDALGNTVTYQTFGKNITSGVGDWDDQCYEMYEDPTFPNWFAMCGFTSGYVDIGGQKDISFAVYNSLADAVVATRHYDAPAGTEDYGADMVYEGAGGISYSLFGSTNGLNGGATGHDFVIVRLNTFWNMSSNASFGTSGRDDAWEMIKTSDGGYLMVGWTDAPGVAGGLDILAIKVTSALTLQWARVIGGAGLDLGTGVRQMSDGGYLISGLTNSFGFGGLDMFAVKLTGAGALSWAKCYGGTGNDDVQHLVDRPGGGVLMAGYCSFPVAPAGNGEDMYIVATDDNGFSGGCNEMNVVPIVSNIGVVTSTGMVESTQNLERRNYPKIQTSPAPTLNCECTNVTPNHEIQGNIQICQNTTSEQYFINPIEGISTYSWSITGGSFSSPPGPNDTLVNVDFTNQNVQIIVTADQVPASCSFAVDTIDITVDSISVQITTPDSILCIGDNTDLTAVTSYNQGAVTGWVWGPTGPNAAVNNVSPVTTTQYTVTVTDGWGCTATDSILVEVYPYPVVDIGPNDTLCNTDSLVLDATTAGATSYLWSTGATSATDTITSSGIYWVDVTNAGSCTTRDSIELILSFSPAANITGDDTICIGESTTLTSTPTGGSPPYTYAWNPGGFSTNSINVSPVTTTTYTVDITGTYGCSTTDSVTVSVFPYPVVDIGPNDTLCNTDSLVLDATTAGATSYLWSTGATSATDTITSSGIYWVDVTNIGGCTTRDSIELILSFSPAANITGNDTICIGQSTTLTSTPTGGSAPYTYLWNPGAFNTNSINVSPVTTTTYTVDITGTYGCSTTDSITVSVFPYPVVDIGPDDTLCNTASLLLDATTAGATSYLWSTSGTNPTETVSVTGDYWVDVTNIGGCTTRDSIYLVFSNSPAANITGTDTICIGQSTTLTSTPSGGSAPYTYVWNPGGFTTNSINVSPATTTTYTVDVTGTFGCSTTDSITVTVFPYPVVDIGPDDTLCNVGPQLLDATTAGATSYLWSTAATTPTETVASSGIYWVDVTNLGGCTTRDSIVLGLSTSPTITMSGNDTICAGQATTLLATIGSPPGPYTFSWNPGGGSVDSITVTPIVTTTYTVTVSEPFGCTNSDSITVFAFPSPTVDLGPDTLLCDTPFVDLVATNPGATYLWSTGSTNDSIQVTTTGIYWVDVDIAGCLVRDSVVLNIGVTPMVTILGDDSICFGDFDTLVVSATGGTLPYTYLWSGTIGVNDSAVVFPTVDSIFTVQVTEQNGCTGVGILPVSVFTYPTVDIGPDSSVCAYDVPFITLDAGNAPLSTYFWSTGDATQTINANSTGTYWVDVANHVCRTRDSVYLFFSDPVSAFTGNTTICAGQPTVLTGNGTGGASPYTYTWSLGPTTGNNMVFSPTTTTNYTLITQDNIGCSDTLSFTINVNPLPSVNLGPDSVACSSPVTLNAPPTTGSILWSTGSTATSINVAANDTVWLEITENGCTTRDSIVITFSPLPSVNLGPDTVVCTLPNFTLDATNPGATYVWSTTETTPTINVTQGGWYWVDVTICGNVANDSINVTVDTFDVFVVNITPNECGFTDGSITVGDNSLFTPTNYLWTMGASGTNPTITNLGDGTYEVTVTDAAGCTATETVVLTCIAPTLTINQLVTPNGDGRNDTWIINEILSYPNLGVKIFNRWGNLVYSNQPYNNDWDGRSNSNMSLGNDLLPTGTYFYMVDLFGDGSDVRTGYLELQP